MWCPQQLLYKNDVRLVSTPIVWRRAHVLFILFLFDSSLPPLFEGEPMFYLYYFSTPIVWRRAHVLFILFLFDSSLPPLFEEEPMFYLYYLCLTRLYPHCLKESPCFIYIICVWLVSTPIVWRRAHVLFILFVFDSSLPPVFEREPMFYLYYFSTTIVWRRAHVLFILFVFDSSLPPLFEGEPMFYLYYFCLTRLYHHCLKESPCFIYIICVWLVSTTIVWRRAHVLFILFVFDSSLPPLFEEEPMFYLYYLCLTRLYPHCLKESPCFIYIICVWLVSTPIVWRRAHALFILFVFDSSLPPLFEREPMFYLYYFSTPIVWRRAHALYILFLYPHCLKESPCFICIICLPPLFEGEPMFYLYYLCLTRLYPHCLKESPCFIYIICVWLVSTTIVWRRAHVLFILYLYPHCLKESPCFIYIISLPPLFEGEPMFYLYYFSTPIVWRRAHVLFILFLYPHCLKESPCFIYIISLPPLFEGEPMFYLYYFSTPIVWRRIHVLFILFLYPHCLKESPCFIYIISLPPLFEGEPMFYLYYFSTPIVWRRAHVLFILFPYPHCLKESPCFIYIICVWLVSTTIVWRRAHVLFILFVFDSSLPPLFEGELMFYLYYLYLTRLYPHCLKESPCFIYIICVWLVSTIIVWKRAHVLFILFLYPHCLKESPCFIYIISLPPLFEGEPMFYLYYFSTPIVWRRIHVLFILFLYHHCLKESPCFIYIISLPPLFEGEPMFYLYYFSTPIVWRRAHVLFILFVFDSSLPPLFEGEPMLYLYYLCLTRLYHHCLKESSCFIYIICIWLVSTPIVWRRAHVLFILFVFDSSLPPLFEGEPMFYLYYLCLTRLYHHCLKESSCFIYIICIWLVSTPIVWRRVYVLFILFLYPHCLKESPCFIYIICVWLVSTTIVWRRAHVLFILFVFDSSLPPLFEGEPMFYLYYLYLTRLYPHCLKESPCFIYIICVWLVSTTIVWRRAHVLFILFVFDSSLPPLFEGEPMFYLYYLCLTRLYHHCLKESSCFIYIICIWLVSTPIVWRRVYVLFILFLYPHCLKESPCFIYIICVWLVSTTIVWRRAHVLFILFVFDSSLPPLFEGEPMFYLYYLYLTRLYPHCLKESPCFIYIICVWLVSTTIVWRRAHVLFILFVFDSSLPPLFEGELMFYLYYLCLFTYIMVSITSWLYDCMSYMTDVLSEERTTYPSWVPGLTLGFWSVLLIVLVFCVLFVFVLCLVCPVLPVFLDCQFLIAPSVFSNVYSCCQVLLIVHSWLPLRFSLTFTHVARFS